MSKTDIFYSIPRSGRELNELREKRAQADSNITFELGESVICIFAQGTKNLHVGHIYVVEKETENNIFIKINTGGNKSYLSEYKKWRFTFPNIDMKIREIKIDSII